MYKSKVKRMYHKINKFIYKMNLTLQDELNRMYAELLSVNEALKNITTAFEKGAYTDDIFERSEALQTRKLKIESEIERKKQVSRTILSDDDVNETIAKCKQLIRNPFKPENKAFIKFVLKRIEVEDNNVKIILNTGLSVNDDFDTVIEASRDEIYNYGRSVKNAC